MNLQISLCEYFESLGINVNLKTKARGHVGFCLKNRIDVSKYTPKERIVPVLLHEFAHFIHSKMEKNIAKTGGSIEILFDVTSNEPYFSELLSVTNFIDKNSLCEKLYCHKNIIKEKIKEQENIIKSEYPKFQRSKKFKDFDKFIKHSKAKYLLKYDRVRLVTGFFRKNEEIFSINNIKTDFPQIKPAFASYIEMRSLQRKQAKISRRINSYKKYYELPTELFARFIEGIYLDREIVKKYAPNSYDRFVELLEEEYYFELTNVVEILNLYSKNEQI